MPLGIRTFIILVPDAQQQQQIQTILGDESGKLEPTERPRPFHIFKRRLEIPHSSLEIVLVIGELPLPLSKTRQTPKA